MKHLITLALVGSISGCSWFMTQPFDNVEYDKFVRLQVGLTELKEVCSSNMLEIQVYPPRHFDMVHRLRGLANETAVYVRNIPDNEEAILVAESLVGDFNEMKKQYDDGNGNNTYCRLKAGQILLKVESALETLGAKGRL